MDHPITSCKMTSFKTYYNETVKNQRQGENPKAAKGKKIATYKGTPLATSDFLFAFHFRKNY